MYIFMKYAQQINAIKPTLQLCIKTIQRVVRDSWLANLPKELVNTVHDRPKVARFHFISLMINTNTSNVVAQGRQSEGV